MKNIRRGQAANPSFGKSKTVLSVFFVLFLQTLFLPTVSEAIVNIEASRSLNQRQGLSGEVELALGGSSGNTEKRDVNVGARIQSVQGIQTRFAILRYAYGESNRRRDTDRTLFHARNIRKVSKGVAEELFMQASRDDFARLSFRGLVGGGERFTLTEQNERQVYLGMGAFYAMETIEKREGTTDAGKDRFWRLNTYFSYQIQANHQVHLISTTYYQPVIDVFSDYRILEEAALSVKMSENFHLKLSFNLTYDSQPPQTIKKTDTIYSTGLEYSF